MESASKRKWRDQTAGVLFSPASSNIIIPKLGLWEYKNSNNSCQWSGGGTCIKVDLLVILNHSALGFLKTGFLSIDTQG
jgi:hypothetical protein